MFRLSIWIGLGALLAAGAARAEFQIQDTPGDHLDVLCDGKVAARWMYAYDKAKLGDTYKPYLHVFDADGKTTITKGPGGTFTHHRGIFIGWNKIGFDGKTFDRWHMKGGEMVQQEFLRRTAGKDQAEIQSLIHWNDESGKPIVVEERAQVVRKAALPGRLIVDFSTKLSAPRGDVDLKGDPEHAGVQFRPSSEIDPKLTVYVFPVEKATPTKDLDYPWVGESFTVAGKRYSVVDMNHPSNPKNTRYSAYRDYGRFGAFFETKIPKGGSLELKYRFLIADGEMPAADAIQKCWDEFAGKATASPVPKTCAVSAAAKAAPKKPEPKKK